MERTDAHRYVPAFSEISGIFLYFGKFSLAYSFSVSSGTLRWHFFLGVPLAFYFHVEWDPSLAFFFSTSLGTFRRSPVLRSVRSAK